MYQEFFSRSPLLALPLFALAIFIAVFAMIVLRAFSPRSREVAAHMERFPLDDEHTS
jgi:cbb3-type cytochrome oxidase subunit 3